MQPATQRQELKRLVEIYAVRTRELSVPAPPELHVAVTPSDRKVITSFSPSSRNPKGAFTARAG